MPCTYCKTVNTLCFWGPRPEARWKRPALLALSLLLGGGAAVLLWMLVERPGYLLFAAIAALCVVVSVLSVLVVVNGCDACVARLMGDA